MVSLCYLKRCIRAVVVLGVVTGLAAPAVAEDFFGFDPANYSGEMPSAEMLKAMKEAAMAVTPPRNGENYVFAFANLQRDITFGILVEGSIVENAELAGVELVIADNRLDGPTALANAESFIQRDVDFVIEFQTDIAFGPTIMKRFDEAGIGVTAIDIPMPGAGFFGADNPGSGFMGGSFLGQAAMAKWGDKVKDGYLVVGDLPQSGLVVSLRTGGQIAGFFSAVPGFPEDHVIKIDTKNTLQTSFAEMNNVIGRIPEGVPILVTAINDGSTTGMLRAVKQAGRESDMIAVGLGADELETLTGEKQFLASVGYFPERYGNYLLPMAFMSLAGKTVPNVFATHYMVTTQNVCEYYEDHACGAGEAVAFDLPQADYDAHMDMLRADPDLEEVHNLIP